MRNLLKIDCLVINLQIPRKEYVTCLLLHFIAKTSLCRGHRTALTLRLSNLSNLHIFEIGSFFGSYEIWHYIILLKFHLGYFRTYRKILFGPVPVNCCKLITYDDRIAHSQHDHLQYINARFGLYYSPEFENRSLLCPVMCYVQKIFLVVMLCSCYA